MTAETHTVDDVLATLQHQLANVHDQIPIADRARDALFAREGHLSARIDTIRGATATLAAVEPQIASLRAYLDFLTTARKTLCDELLALPPRIRTSLDLGKQQNLQLSISSIDRGVTGSDAGYTLDMLRLGALMREAGVSWRGTLPDVERRLQAAQAERDNAQRQLDDALMTDEQRAAQAAEAVKRNAMPQRKTRGDGSQYDKYPDGRVVEVTS